MLNKLVDSNANNPGEFWKALTVIKKREITKIPVLILFKGNGLTILKS
jgi:hypothetical protein